MTVSQISFGTTLKRITFLQIGGERSRTTFKKAIGNIRRSSQRHVFNEQFETVINLHKPR